MSLVISLIFISTILLGCQSGENTKIDTNKTKAEKQTESVTKTNTNKDETSQQLEEDNGNLKLKREISKVSISHSKGSDTSIFDDDKSLKTFESIILSAVKESGLVNMADPEFNMDVVYANKNKRSYYLWIGEKGQKSVLMKTDDTYTVYTVSEEMTDTLIDLIE